MRAAGQAAANGRAPAKERALAKERAPLTERAPATERPASRERESVLVLAPSGRDAALAIRLLARHGVPARACGSVAELCSSLDHSGCALIAQEALTRESLAQLGAQLRAQPAWSDFPFILLAFRSPPGRSTNGPWQALGNVTVLERPTQSRTLLTAVDAALRARRRQYEAEQAIAHRDQFLAMLGHELRNPLAAIWLATEAQRRDVPAGAAPATQRSNEIIARQARHLSRLVDDLLDVARVTTGKVSLSCAPLAIWDVVERCVQNVELSARENHIDIATLARDPDLAVLGDAVRLEEVIINLLSNAIKYSSPHSRVEVTARADADTVVLQVKDHGIGISPEMLPRVFDLFTQAEVSLDRSRGGLGIGLTLVKSLIDLHGGSITAESAGLGRGSTFSIRLPRHAGLVEQSPPSSRHLSAAKIPISVLVVDDNADLLEMIEEILVGFGCQVQTANDGPRGLERLAELAPMLAFIDIGLPGLDGYAVARHVRSVPGHQPWLVALTGYGQPEDRERALAAGFDQHLTKPVSVAALREAVEAATAARTQRAR